MFWPPCGCRLCLHTTAFTLYLSFTTRLLQALLIRPESLARPSGLQVVLLLAPEHRGLVRPCLRLGRLFIHNIVDRLHVVLVMSAHDSKDLGAQV